MSIESPIKHGNPFDKVIREMLEEAATAAAPTAPTILDTARGIVTGARQTTHGAPERSFALIATYWSAHLDTNVSPADVAAMMVLLKLAREKCGSGSPDNPVDATGYSALWGQLWLRRARHDPRPRTRSRRGRAEGPPEPFSRPLRGQVERLAPVPPDGAGCTSGGLYFGGRRMNRRVVHVRRNPPSGSELGSAPACVMFSRITLPVEPWDEAAYAAEVAQDRAAGLRPVPHRTCAVDGCRGRVWRDSRTRCDGCHGEGRG